jgi:hypothetical protein
MILLLITWKDKRSNPSHDNNDDDGHDKEGMEEKAMPTPAPT